MKTLVLLLALSFVGFSSGQSCGHSPADIVYVLDGSSSVGAPNFQIMLDSLADTVVGLNIGPSNTQSHVGLVTFSTIAYFRFNLAAYTSSAPMVADIQSTPYPNTRTCIGCGINMALNQVFGQAGDRASVPDVMVVITDGTDNENGNVPAAAAAAHARGITVWAIGIGNDVNNAELTTIAGSPDRVRTIATFDALNDTLSELPCPDKACARTCMDQYPECAGWANSGFCKSSNIDNLHRTTQMEKDCPVSCGYCKEKCQDIECPEQCAARAAKGECENNMGFMLTRCKKTCNACNSKCSNLHMGCPWFKYLGYCDSTDLDLKSYMHFNCRASCNLCVPYHECGIRDVSGKCPRDWKYNPTTDKCYYATDFKDTFANIETKCKQIQGDVASVQDDNENDFLANYLPPSDRDLGEGFGNMACYYIGLRRGNQSPTGWNAGYSFWTDTMTYSYRNWDTTSPPQPTGFDHQPNQEPGENNAIQCHPGSPNPLSPSNAAIIHDKQWHDQYEQFIYPGFCKRSTCTNPSPSPSSPSFFIAGKNE